MKNCLILILATTFVLFNFGCATQDYQILKGADKKNAEDWFKTANVLYQVRDYGFAIDYYEKIIENYPDSIYAYTVQRKLKNARRHYLNWATQSPKFKSRRKGRQSKHYLPLEGVDKKSAENWLKTANVLYSVRDYGAAIDYYEKIIENYPDSIYAYTAQRKLKKVRKYYLRNIKRYK